MEEHIGARINIARLDQALPLQPKTIATGCPYCAIMPAGGLAAAGNAERIGTSDIAELVAAALMSEPAAA